MLFVNCELYTTLSKERLIGTGPNSGNVKLSSLLNKDLLRTDVMIGLSSSRDDRKHHPLWPIPFEKPVGVLTFAWALHTHMNE